MTDEFTQPDDSGAVRVMREVQALRESPVTHVTPLDTSPAWVRSLAGEYVHRVRHATHYVSDWGTLGIESRTHYTAWCGYGLSSKKSQVYPERPTKNVCGTCEGRFEGWQRTHGSIFAPRDGFRVPDVCPGGGTIWYLDAYTHPDATCEVCGKNVELWGGKLRQHAPAGRLVDPCPLHAWKHLRFVHGVVLCACQLTKRG